MKPEERSFEESRSRVFVILCIALSCPIMIGFAIIDCLETDILELTVDILIFSIFLIGAIGVKIFKADFLIYLFSPGF